MKALEQHFQAFITIPQTKKLEIFSILILGALGNYRVKTFVTIKKQKERKPPQTKTKPYPLTSPPLLSMVPPRE